MTKIFEQAMNDIPQDVQEKVSLNFDVIDQINAILKQKGMTQRDLARLYYLCYSKCPWRKDHRYPA